MYHLHTTGVCDAVPLQVENDQTSQGSHTPNLYQFVVTHWQLGMTKGGEDKRGTVQEGRKVGEFCARVLIGSEMQLHYLQETG